MPIKWLIFDLDGTLIDHTNNQRYVSTETINTLKKIIATNKYKVTIATGRHYLDAILFLEEFKIKLPKDSFIIGSNGAQIYSIDEQKLIYDFYLSTEAKDKIEHNIKKYLEDKYQDRCMIFVYGNKNEIAFLKNPIGTKYLDYIKEMKTYESVDQNIFKYLELDNLDQVEAIYKAILYIDHEFDYNDLIKDINQIDSSLRCLKTLATCIELVPDNVDKLEAIKILNRQYNINAEQIAAFGDSFNDYKMLEFAKTSVTRASADKEIQAICSHVIDARASDFVGDALLMLVEF